jgi:hypothetical protein
VVQLRAAGERAEAEWSVRTYVISGRMIELLERLVIPQLQPTTPAGNWAPKGGGQGKSLRRGDVKRGAAAANR